MFEPNRWLLAVVLLACAVCFSANLPDPDFWGHVQYGQDLLRDGFPWESTYTYTAVHHPWINHENLAELAFAIGVNSIGAAGLLVTKCLLGVGMVALMLRHAHRQGVGPMTIGLTLVLVALNEMFFWNMRPQLFSLVAFVGLMELLTWCFVSFPDRNRLRGLWLAIPLFVVWGNAHGGVLAGMGIFGAYLTGKAAEWAYTEVQRRKAKTVSSSSRPGVSLTSLCVHFGLLIAATAATMLINPYGLRLPLWLAESLGNPRPEIGEWTPPGLLDPAWMPFWFTLGLTIAALITSRKPRDATQVIILAVTIWQCLEHRRHIAFFGVLFGYWLPVHVESLFGWLGRSIRNPDKPTRWLIAPLGLTAVLLLGLLASQLRGMPVRRDIYPVSAFQYIADQKLHGRAVVAFRGAQYALAAFGPRGPNGRGITLAFDGRYDTCYPLFAVDMYFDFEAGDLGPQGRWRCPSSPPFDAARILEYGRPDLVLLEREQSRTVEIVASRSADWVLLYQDELAQLWGRRSRFDDVSSPDYVPPSRRQIGNERQTGFVAWPGFPE